MDSPPCIPPQVPRLGAGHPAGHPIPPVRCPGASPQHICTCSRWPVDALPTACGFVASSVPSFLPSIIYPFTLVFLLRYEEDLQRLAAERGRLEEESGQLARLLAAADLERLAGGWV